MRKVTKNLLLLSTALFSMTYAISASPTLVVGTPSNSYLSTPSAVSPRFGTLINFDTLTPLTALSSTQYSSQGVTSISSPDGLTVEPYSTQSGPNEIVDNGAGGTADIAIKLAIGANAVGLGIADSDPVTLTLQALNASGDPFGTAFSINIANTGDPNNPGNGYYIVNDTSYDIYGLILTQTSSNANYSGLAIDDLQFVPAPEPFSAGLLALGGAVLLVFTTRGRKRV